MNEQKNFPRLSEEELKQRDAFIANKRAKEARSILTTTILAAAVIGCALWGGFYAVNNHRAERATAALKAAQEQDRIQAQAAKEAAIQAERDFQAAHAGALYSWEVITGNRNPIKGWPVRRREAILNDIANKELEINAIRSQMRAATTQNNYTYSNPNGTRGAGTVNSYNVEQMNQLRNQLQQAQQELYLFQMELVRDDYFKGKISGDQL